MLLHIPLCLYTIISCCAVFETTNNVYDYKNSIASGCQGSSFGAEADGLRVELGHIDA